MKKYLLFFVVPLLLFSPSFAQDVRLLDWTPRSDISLIDNKRDAQTFQSNGNFPLILSKPDLFVAASNYRFLKIKMSSTLDWQGAKVFFKRIGDPDFSMYNAYEFQTGRSGKKNAYIIDLWKNVNWVGMVNQLMISPANGVSTIEIYDARFVEPNLFTHMKSLWQEFMIFEVPQMRTVNFIYGPKINGVSINTYIYWGVFLVFFIIFSYNMLNKRSLNDAFVASGKQLIIFCLSIWILLDIRSAVDQAKTVSYDNASFKGKTLEERRALITLGDYYSFLTFAGSAIPKGSSFDIVNPSYYYFREKAMYYLYPTYWEDKKDAKYIIVYDPNKQPDLAEKTRSLRSKGYSIYKTYKEGEYILIK